MVVVLTANMLVVGAKVTPDQKCIRHMTSCPEDERLRELSDRLARLPDVFCSFNVHDLFVSAQLSFQLLRYDGNRLS